MSLLEEAFWGAGWDESQHPRHPAGTPEGGQFMRLYHVSPVGNREAIREKGLVPDAEKRYTDSGEGVYVFGSRDEAWRFATTGERMYGDSDIWEIEAGDLALERDPFFEPGHPMAERAIAQFKGEKPDAFVTQTTIPPESLTLHPNPWHPDPITQHRLVESALQSWVGDPATMRIHMQDEVDGIDPSPGPAERYREQAAALLQAVREGGANSKRLYRGASRLADNDIPESWTESKAVAKAWAKRYKGEVFTLEPGEGRGIRMRDYIESGLDVNSEKQWLIDPLSRQAPATPALSERTREYLSLVKLAHTTSKSHRSRIEKRINNHFNRMTAEERAAADQHLRSLRAAAWDPAEHPRHEAGVPEGGRFRPTTETEVIQPTVETLASLKEQLLEAEKTGVWARRKDDPTALWPDTFKHSSNLSHAFAALEGGSADELYIQSDMNEDEYEEAMYGETPNGGDVIATHIIVARDENGTVIGVGDFSEFTTQVGAGVIYGGSFGAVKGGGLPLFARFLDEAVTRGKGASWTAGNKRAGDLYMRLGIPNRGGPGAYSLTRDEARELADDMFAFARRNRTVTAALEAMVSAGWREEDHPRDPGGEGGGQFIAKGTVAADEEAAPGVRLPKFAEAQALRDRLYELDVEDALGGWVLEDWGNWTLEQQRELMAWLDKQLQESKTIATDIYDEETGERTGQRYQNIQSGMLSVDYSKEIGMSYSKERNQARSLVKALDKHIAYAEAISLGMDPMAYAEDLFAVQPKKKTINPRDQGIPEEYLSEKGTFKPGFDAKLKSDLVNSYFELDPKKSRFEVGQVSEETRQLMIDNWKGRNPNLLVAPGGGEYGDEELWQIVQRDFNDPAMRTAHGQATTEIRRRFEKETRTTRITESTLIHRFDPKDAERILEERGWTKFLNQKRDKMRGMLERSFDRANELLPGYGDQLQREIGRAREAWGDALDVKGERFGLVQAQVSELGHLEPEIGAGLAANGVKIYVGPGPSTDLDEMWHLSDERARGWGNTYLDKVGGFYSPSSKTVIVSATAPSSTDGLMAHEIGHAIGDVFDIDNHDELNRYHRKLFNQVRSYFRQGGKGSYAGRQELWAEGVSAVLRNRQEGEFDRRAINAGKKDTGPFKEYDYDALSPEAKEYLDWVDKTLREIAKGKHIAS